MGDNVKYIGKMLMHPETKRIMTEDYYHFLVKLDLVPFCDWKLMDFIVLEDCKEIFSEDKATLTGMINGKQFEVVHSLEEYIKEKFFVYQECEEEDTQEELGNSLETETEIEQGNGIMFNEFANYIYILNKENAVTIATDNEAFSQDEMVMLITDILDGLKIDYEPQKNDDQTFSIDLCE
ncbi:hypothetical protein [Brevibacillus laterosporus]|uniref:Uncharacterized protein n=1 Tax=Brevibacillus laterosporus TaxID=1465 RepID=A0AAP8QGM1_BRELA|nr:hypothetical protein [Brevibacillus laterosporus]PPB12851.1 hypothetical protein C4A77_00255 [Brevibacillus laterosporus]